MKVISYTTTTSDYPYTLYLETTLKSLRKYNDFKVVVFVLDDGIDRLKYISEKYSDVELVNFSQCETSNFDISKIPLNVSDIFNFDTDKFVSILVGPECLDYMYKNYDYDVVFRFDTDVIFTDKVNFEDFYGSGKSFGGCKELFWHQWTKQTFGYSCLHKDVYNVGLSMFRKDKQIPNMYQRMLEFFESVDYKINTFEQDAVNSMYTDCYDLNQQMCLAVNRLDNKVSAVHFSSPELKPLSLNLKDEYTYLIKYYQEWVKTTYPDLWNSKKCFYSSVDGDKFIDLFIVTVTSYKKHNVLPVDWIVICKDVNQMYDVRSKTQFLSDSVVNVIYTTMPAVPVKIDYCKYNTFKWTSDYTGKIFCDRIYFVDVWKHKYDLMVCVDLDVIFVNTVVDVLDDFLHSNCAVGGQCEPFLIRYGFEKCIGKTYPGSPYNFEKYVNFGFGMINTKLIIDDNFKKFAEISKDKEDFFNTQEQAYFACQYQDSIKTYPGLQALVWSRINSEHFKQPYNFRLIHFAPSRFLFDEIIKLGYDYNYANIILFYDKYVEIALQSKISKEFRNVLLHNSKRKFDSFIALKMKLELKY